MKGKTKKVYDHLKEKGSITSWEAIQKYRATRLSAIIYNLRNDYGLNITTTNKEFKLEDGTKGTFAEYRLEEEND